MTIRLAIGHYLPIGDPLEQSLYPALFEILASKCIGVTTLTFQGHVTSSVTWPLDSWWPISYWWSFGPKSLLLIDTMLNRHCACAISRDVHPYVKYIKLFQFLTPTLPIQYVTFIGLRWRIRGVLSLSWPLMLKAKSSEKFSKSKNLRKFWPICLWTLDIRRYEKLRFYCKGHILAWIHVVWAIASKSVGESDL